MNAVAETRTHFTRPDRSLTPVKGPSEPTAAQVAVLVSGEGAWETPTGDAAVELSPGITVRPTATPPEDPAGRREYIEQQLLANEDLEQLEANVPDDPTSFQALLDILHEDFNVIVVDLKQEGQENFNTGDLLNLANQLNNLPEEIVDDYISAGQEIRLVNGDVTQDPRFRELNAGFVNEQGQFVGADGSPIEGDGGVHTFIDSDGAGVSFISLDALREDGGGTGGAEVFDGSDSTVLHELAHGLDNIGGFSGSFMDISDSAEFQALINDPAVWDFIDGIQNGDFHSDPANAGEHFAELFANYYASPELREQLPPAVQDYFAGLDLMPTIV